MDPKTLFSNTYIRREPGSKPSKSIKKNSGNRVGAEHRLAQGSARPPRGWLHQLFLLISRLRNRVNRKIYTNTKR